MNLYLIQDNGKALCCPLDGIRKILPKIYKGIFSPKFTEIKGIRNLNVLAVLTCGLSLSVNPILLEVLCV